MKSKIILTQIFCGLSPFSGFARLFAEKLCFSECRLSSIRGFAGAYAEKTGRGRGLSVCDPAAKPQENRAAIGEAELHRK